MSCFGNKETFVNVSLITLGSIAYILCTFFRGSIAPILDVFEHEFHATSSQVGFMSSAFWLSYFLMQIPSGILIQYLTPQFIILISLILFSILSFLFALPLNSMNIALPTLIFILSGVSLAPIALAVIALIGIKLGSNSVALVGGLLFFASSVFVFACNVLQAWLYQQYQLWRPVYWVLSGVVASSMLLFWTTSCVDTKWLSTQQSFRHDHETESDIVEQELHVHADTFDGGQDVDASKEEQQQTNIVCVDEEEAGAAKPDRNERKRRMKRRNHTVVSELPPFLVMQAFRVRERADAATGLENHGLIGVAAVQKRFFGVQMLRQIAGDFKYEFRRAMKCAFTNPWNWLLGLYNFAANGIALSFNGLWLIGYMSLKFGYSRQLSTLISGTFYLSHAVSSIVTGKLAAKYQKRKVFCIWAAVCLCAPIYTVYCTAQANMYVIIAMNMVTGMGTGIESVLFALVREYNDGYECSDIAGGLFNTLNCSAGFVIPSLIGVLMDQHWESRHGQLGDRGERIYALQDYNHGFVLVPMCSALYLLLALILKETNAQTIRWDDSRGYFVRYFWN